MEENNREHFRIVYPPPQRPSITLNGRSYHVVEVSEGGCSLLAPREEALFKVGQSFRAMITFGKRGNESVTGVFVRVDGSKFSVRFDEGVGIPLPRIMEEQRYLIKLTQP